MAKNNHFDFTKAQIVRETIVRVCDTLEADNQKMQHNFQALNDSWKDPIYYEYKKDFADANRTVAKAIKELHELNLALLEYEKLMRDAL